MVINKFRAFWCIICLCSCSEEKGHHFFWREAMAVLTFLVSIFLESYDQATKIMTHLTNQSTSKQPDCRAKLWLVKSRAESWKDCSTERNQMSLALDIMYSTLRENVIREVFKRPHRIVALEWNQYIFLSTSISTIYIVKSNELKEKNHQSIKSLHKL